MNLLSPNLTLPKIELQYIKKNNEKYFMIISDEINQLMINMIKNKEIRIQIWLERQVRKRSGNGLKRSWVHSNDFSTSSPKKLFSEDEYNYGAGDGWGWKKSIPTYSTTNGIVPTEFEISINDIKYNKIFKKISILDIFTNILKYKNEDRWPINEDEINNIAFVSRSNSCSQPIRYRLVMNYNGKMINGLPSIPLVIGIHKNKKAPLFNTETISSIVKISYYK